MSADFGGFQDSKNGDASIPATFFREILPAIQDINELKLIIYLLWKASAAGDFTGPFTRKGILLDKLFTDGLISSGEKADDLVDTLLEKAVSDNILIKGAGEKNGDNATYFINSPRGREAAQESNLDRIPAHVTLDSIQPNIFALYQENIGPLTPIIADALRSAEKEYSPEWINEAIQIAVKNNVRRWRYVESVLDRWQKEGRDGTDRENNKEDYRRYIKG